MQRVVINGEHLGDELLNLTLTSLRVCNVVTGEAAVPENLAHQDAIFHQIEPMALWKDFRYAALGKAYDILRAPKRSEAANHNIVDIPSAMRYSNYGADVDPTSHTSHEERLKFQRVLNWTQKTIGDSDPNEIEPKRPLDINGRVGSETEEAPSVVMPGVLPLDKPLISFDELLRSSGTTPPPEPIEQPSLTFEELMEQNGVPKDHMASTRAQFSLRADDGVQKTPRVDKLPEPSRQSSSDLPDLKNGDPSSSLQGGRTIGRISNAHQPSFAETLRNSQPQPNPPRGRSAGRATSHAGRTRGGVQHRGRSQFDQMLSGMRGSAQQTRAVQYRGNPNRRGRSYNQPGRGRSHADFQRNRVPFSVPSLIDAGPAAAPQMATPTHWDSRGPFQLEVLSSDTASEVENVRIPALIDQSNHGSNSLIDFESDVGTSISQRAARNPEFYVNDEPHRCNVASLRQLAIDEYSQNKEGSGSGTERLQQVDEVNTRKIRDTMGQRAAKTSKANTEEEKQKKIAEAWGLPPIPKDRVDLRNGVTSTSGGGQRNAGQTREERLSDKELFSKATQVREILLETFHALRPFPAEIKLEVQAGQILSSLPRDRWGNHFHTREQWEQIFTSSKHSFIPKSYFTNVVTNNGAEVDMTLDLTHDNKGPLGSRVFEAEPFERKVTYEFHCQTRSSEQFLLRVDQNGAFKVSDLRKPISVTNIHFAANIWDACIMVTAIPCFSTTLLVQEAVKDLVNSLHIEASERLNIVFRVPMSNEIEILSAKAERTSFHRCVMQDHEDIALQVTEVQNLYLKSHETDMNLWLASAGKNDRILLTDNRLHYELSLISSSVKAKLSTHESIEMGEIDNAWTEQDLVSQKTVNKLLALTSILVKGIDGVGLCNQGTAMLQYERGQRTTASRVGGHSDSVARGHNRFSRRVDAIGDSKSDLAPEDSATAVGVKTRPLNFIHGIAGKEQFW